MKEKVSYRIEKSKLKSITIRLMSTIASFGTIFWFDQKFFTNHQIIKLCPLIETCFVILSTIVVTIFIVEPTLKFLLRRNRSIKVIKNDAGVEIVSHDVIIENDENYHCMRVKIGDKWEIVKLAHRMKKSDRLDYLKDDDDTTDDYYDTLYDY